MKTKKIIADSMPHALKLVRQELGENAIIVNTAVVKTGGLFGLFAKQKYEVTAYSIDDYRDRPEPKFSVELKQKPDRQAPAINTFESKNEEKEHSSSGFHSKPQNLYQYYSQPQQHQQHPQQHQEQPKEQAFGAVPPVVQNQPIVERNQSNVAPQQQADEEFIPLFEKAKPKSTPVIEDKNDSNTQVLDELQQMRKMMMNYMMTDKDRSAMPAVVSKWVNHLKKQGVDDEIIEHLIDNLLQKYEDINTVDQSTIKQELGDMMLEIIRNKVPDSVAVDEKTRMINMIGPTGVGKTTSIAKLATEQVLKQKRRVAMITTDVYRIAAVEQLKTYAGILNVPIEVVRSAEELKLVLDKLAHYDLIYMDTTGRNYKEEKFRESINQYLDHPFQNDNYLVLSLTTKYEDMQLLLNEFKESPINKLILTKFDETSSYGSILNIAYKYPYQISYLTNGQSVPEDILAFDAKLIVNHLLGEENSDGSSTNPQGIYASI
ncbi:flagellar biosynthesis protein FlhF [Bacillus sp. DNRA2]|uniref:flagellar biosynthesis protein FlhF n=1 Tax=Bacillus sp. DNRA2 TaxID=2723053 RepID=UPI00145DA34B|nr:flagellar biosynthesis protein FlhF [Bacillus sp. DNRA2]NMD69104.1 flagellar biosynthesis protein FlhF [Bacillus sp. DNRA2]